MVFCKMNKYPDSFYKKKCWDALIYHLLSVGIALFPNIYY